MDIIRTHPVTQDIPLPGHYPVLTLQLNVTRYSGANTLRMVLVVREPSDHIEIHRESFDVAPDSEDLGRAIGEHVAQAVAQMRWMQQGTTS